MIVVWVRMLAGIVLSGCGTFPTKPHTARDREPSVMQEVMERRNKLVLLSSAELRPDRPILLLLHGATDDPSEMMGIAREWARTHNVLLYSYNFHQPLKKIGWDLLTQIRALKSRLGSNTSESAPARSMTVINYSYSAIIFRKAVLLADDEKFFAGTALVQLVPTAGGSFLARGMRNAVAAWLVSMASKASAAQNPYGTIAEELWEGEGNRKFYEAIDPQRMHTFLVEGDSHSLANVADDSVLQRYQNGLGPNVVTIPRDLGVTHENVPNHPVVLAHLRKILESISDDERAMGSKTKASTGSMLATAGSVVHQPQPTGDDSIR
jgi:hypothetical protein